MFKLIIICSILGSAVSGENSQSMLGWIKLSLVMFGYITTLAQT